MGFDGRDVPCALNQTPLATLEWVSMAVFDFCVLGASEETKVAAIYAGPSFLRNEI